MADGPRSPGLRFCPPARWTPLRGSMLPRLGIPCGVPLRSCSHDAKACDDVRLSLECPISAVLGCSWVCVCLSSQGVFPDVILYEESRKILAITEWLSSQARVVECVADSEC